MPAVGAVCIFSRSKAGYKKVKNLLKRAGPPGIRELQKENARLQQELDELKLIFQNTMEHGTFIENELDEQIRKATILSLTDPLTGIYNRLKLHQSLSQEINRRTDQNVIPCLIMFDIDGFKQVNDRFGHHTGDAVLIELISLVAAMIRKCDIFARWGGEEFIILALHRELDGCRLLAERIRREIEKHRFPRVGRLTCSFGVTQMSADDTTDDILQRVDRAMYMAKYSGRNCVMTL